MAIADRLKTARGDLSQKAAALKCGIKQQAWNSYEKGVSIPGGEAIQNICRSLAISADWLLGLDGGAGGQRATASGAGAIAVVGANATVSAGRPGTPPAVPADCSKCRLMQAHLREITGRG